MKNLPGTRAETLLVNYLKLDGNIFLAEVLRFFYSCKSLSAKGNFTLMAHYNNQNASVTNALKVKDICTH